jgi:WD40 repeat protein
MPKADTLISCSNDTTIKLWKIYPFEDTFSETGETILPYSTLNNHTDYVRTIVQAADTDKLISASDDGQLNLWDLTAERLIQKYD